MAAWATRITRRELIPQETQMVPSGSLTSDTRDMRAILGNGVIKSECDLLTGPMMVKKKRKKTSTPSKIIIITINVSRHILLSFFLCDLACWPSLPLLCGSPFVCLSLCLVGLLSFSGLVPFPFLHFPSPSLLLVSTHLLPDQIRNRAIHLIM